ncbi:ATP-binding protein [Deinococcus cellulosilyticus]|uniref:histidine kinase n=1 Tax=Deinococcus cellulosilyticus (strain DSM 18568 / NBRC 106333 / KACC 11606 / 5516J-15) TaxID=1223518 RepID=A0A511MVE8_DEIC1|nr:ATP-binding protein [Deinococcus cellulosilyticus]GEM44559.1 histidine kinase [Deinococcus cellulosilyticus NBRC 106333 = KACC 11606]
MKPLENLDLLPPDSPIDLTNCDREPIHTPGLIQPHGVMLVMQEEDFRIVQVSANVDALLGLSPERLLDVTIQEFMGEEQLRAFQEALNRDDLETNPLFVFPLRFSHGVLFDAVAHRKDGWVILELEPTPPAAEWSDRYRQMSSIMNRVSAAPTLQQACERLAREVRQLTGYDRVMIYQFAQDGTGQVIAEEFSQGMESFLGLRYPASDIPKQARALYVMNHIRVIGSSDYTPVPLLSYQGQGPQPLDMSYCYLRSVSPIHLEYLRNMGVGASMSVSILKDGELWGLIACHHNSPKVLSYSVRAMCEFLGQMLSLQLSSKADHEHGQLEKNMQSSAARIVEYLASTPQVEHAFHDLAQELYTLVRCEGLVVVSGERITTLGMVPSQEILKDWIPLIAEKGRVYATDHLREEWAELDFGSSAGVLSLVLSRSHPELILWFRTEVVQQVTWGGNPDKMVSADGERLSPRKSFEAWQQTVHGRSEPWLDMETSAVRELHRSSLDVVLRRTEELQQLNARLEKSNTELDAFAYVASHDLKEPLRGLHHYAVMLSEDYMDQLEDDARHKLETMVRLTQRLESLIDSLLSYSRVGRVDYAVRKVDLHEVALDTIDLLKPSLERRNAQVLIPRRLPEAVADAVRLGEVFNNLISNGVKYNQSPVPTVELGHFEAQEAAEHFGADLTGPVLYVRDNGIGIPAQHFETIFRFFKRLHTQDAYGGGTGAGLSIAQKIIERHGGRLWVESVEGQGSTFYFTLTGQG